MNWDDYSNMQRFIGWIEAIGTVIEKEDFISVVMCKDCKHLGIKDMCYGYCKGRMNGIVKPDDYCSYGELEEG